MPDMSGIEAQRAIKAFDSDARILMLTLEKQKKTVVCGFLDFLAEYRFKNVDEDAELNIVRVLVGDCNLE